MDSNHIFQHIYFHSLLVSIVTVGKLDRPVLLKTVIIFFSLLTSDFVFWFL